MRHLVLSLVLPFAACGDLQVRSVRAPQSVPQELVGEWVGTWQSTAEATGAIVVRVQEFEGEPVVRVEFENPCIEPRSYDLVVTAASIELRAEGTAVMTATLVEGRQLVGTYHCPEESGTWTASWQRELPAVQDLSGRWSGSLAAAGQPTRAFDIDLVQVVEGGDVLLQGFLWLRDLWPLPLEVEGTVLFRDDAFDLLLRTPIGSVPGVLVTGIGDYAPMRVENGLLQPIGTPVLPFPIAGFTVFRQS